MNQVDTRSSVERHAVSADGDDHRSLAALLKDIRDETTTLFRQEVALARTEISEKMSRVIRNVTLLAAGALVAFAGAIVLLVAAGGGVTVGLEAAGMRDENALWLGPLIVGAIVTVVGLALVSKGKKTLQEESLVPERTVESMKENKEWIKNKAK